MLLTALLYGKFLKIKLLSCLVSLVGAYKGALFENWSKQSKGKTT